MKLYLDYNATTPLDSRVADAMMACLTGAPGNPSSTHQFGRVQRALIDQAREQVAALVGVQSSQVVFTSGGTEANNLALKTIGSGSSVRIAISSVEHPSVLEPAKRLQRHGAQLDLIAVDEQCRVMPDALAVCLRKQPQLVSIMSANNETGVIQDIPALAEQVQVAGAVLHTDAVQSAGKVHLDFAALGVQLMSLSAHKLYGPTGVGALIVDKSLELSPLLLGGTQEKGLRAGTENIAGIVGFGVAAELALQEQKTRSAKLLVLRQRLQAGLQQFSQVTVFAEQAERLPNTVQMAVAGVDGEALLMQMDRAGIAVSSGSACSSASNEPSHVLMAMGVDTVTARGAIRISLGKATNEQDIDDLLRVLGEQIERLQKAGQVAGW